MKAVIMDMCDMSLSKEVYDKKPAKFFAFFIYGLLALVITALAWAYFGHLDIVVRAQGIIRPLGQTIEVFNIAHGEVSEVLLYDGMQVTRGDILYSLDTFRLENDKGVLQEQLDTANMEYASLRLYLQSIEAGVNLIGSINYEFSARLDSFLVNMTAVDHNAATQSEFLQEEARGLDQSLEYALFELQVLRAFEQSIHAGRDMFGSTPATGKRSEIFSTYRNQFQRYVLEMENLRLQIETVQATIDGYSAVRYMAQGGQYYGDVLMVYRNIYNDYILQLNQLIAAYDQARDNHERHEALYEAELIAYVELRAAESRLEAAEAATREHTALFMTSIENEIRNAQNRRDSLQIQSDTLRASNLVSISNQRLTLEAAVLDMNRGITNTQLQQDALLFIDDQPGEVALLRLNEITLTLAQINIAEQEITRLSAALASIESQIEDSIVRAPIDGELITHVEIAEGSFLMAGVHVLSVVPARGESLNAHVFINNHDIGNIEEGMVVRYDIPALPRRNFGEINGVITRISADIAAEDGLQGFFLVETEVEDRMYYDTHGNGVELRVGMGFEARIIVERQRILFYLLDRLNLMVN